MCLTPVSESSERKENRRDRKHDPCHGQDGGVHLQLARQAQVDRVAEVLRQVVGCLADLFQIEPTLRGQGRRVELRSNSAVCRCIRAPCARIGRSAC